MESVDSESEVSIFADVGPLRFLINIPSSLSGEKPTDSETALCLDSGVEGKGIAYK